MKKYLITLFFFSAFFVLDMWGQKVDDNAFASVPLVNGKVVFQQFVHANQNLSEAQKYAILQKWGRDNYTGNPSLSGIRFDDKTRTITVSSKANLALPQSDKITMNYRFDASVTAAGVMLTIRDIAYVREGAKGGQGAFPKSYAAEEMITDQAVNSGGNERELRNGVRKETLAYLNKLYAELASVFQ